jgi:hypothetical protein
MSYATEFKLRVVNLGKHQDLDIIWLQELSFVPVVGMLVDLKQPNRFSNTEIEKVLWNPYSSGVLFKCVLKTINFWGDTDKDDNVYYDTDLKTWDEIVNFYQDTMKEFGAKIILGEPRQNWWE